MAVDTSDSLIYAVREGRLERVRELINSFGLSYSEAEGYVLLRDAVKYEHTAVIKLLLTSGSKVNSKSKKPSNTPLHFAGINGDIKIVKMLLDKGANINAKNKYGRTPLHNAIENEKIEVTELLLKHGAHVNAGDNEGTSPLHVAVMSGCLQIVEHLLKHGAYVNWTSKWRKGYTALHFAVKEGSEEVINLLLSRGANVDAKGEDGITSLYIAVQRGRLQIVEHLLKHGAYVNCACTSTWREGYTPLHIAAEEGSEEIIKFLLSSNAHINASTKDNLTPLFIATINGHEKVVKLLLDHGANVDAQDKNGKAILHLAVEKGYSAIIEHILKYCPDVNNKNNRSSLNAAVHGFGIEYSKIVESLLQYGFSVNPEDINICKLLHAAVEKGYLKIVEDLLKYGTDVNMLYKLTSYTPLHNATIYKRENVATLLINYGADVNAKDEVGNTPIFYAIENTDLKITKLLLTNGADIKDSPELLNTAVKKECREIVEVLLHHDADINASDKYGRTALHFTASSFGFPPNKNPDVYIKTEIAELLLSRGANVDAQDEDGKTILYLAVERRYEVIIEHILKYCPDVNNKSNRSSLNPAVHDYRRECRTIVESLLQYGFSVNPEDINNCKLLHDAVEKGYLKIVEDLLKYGTDVNMLYKLTGYTPLHNATKNKWENVATLLINYGADVNAKDEVGNTPIFYAIENTDLKITKLLLTNGADIKDSPELLYTAVKKDRREIVKVLLQHDADINASDEYGRTALHFTASSFPFPAIKDLNNIKGEIAKLLLSRGANVDAQDMYGITTLFAATQNGYAKVVEALLGYNANVNSGTKNDITPLHLSVEKGNEVISTMLLNKGANVNAQQKDGRTALNRSEYLFSSAGITALHIATQKGYLEIVKILLKFGADIDSRDKYGRTALHIASKEGHEKIVVTLLEYGSDINIVSKSNYTPLDFAMDGIRTFYFKVEKYEKIFKEILKRQIIKMKIASLYVCRNNLLSISSNYRISDFQNECEEEMESIKSEKISNSNVSFHDILTKNISQLAIYARNENIVQVLKSDDYETKFPIYAGIINSRFRKGVERKELLVQEGNRFFDSLFNRLPELPYNCTEKIFSYLSDKDLRVLIDVCEHINIPSTDISDVASTV